MELGMQKTQSLGTWFSLYEKGFSYKELKIEVSRTSSQHFVQQ